MPSQWAGSTTPITVALCFRIWNMLSTNVIEHSFCNFSRTSINSHTTVPFSFHFYYFFSFFFSVLFPFFPSLLPLAPFSGNFLLLSPTTSLYSALATQRPPVSCWVYPCPQLVSFSYAGVRDLHTGHVPGLDIKKQLSPSSMVNITWAAITGLFARMPTSILTK